MTYTPIPIGSPDWGPPINSAFTDQDTRIDANATNISNLTATVAGQGNQIFDLQQRNGGLASASSFEYIGWSQDPAPIGNGQAGVAGTLYLQRINVGAAATATRLTWGNNTAGSGAVAGQNFVALFDSAGTRLANVGVDARVASTGIFNETINVPVSPGFYWIGILINATGMPAIYRGGLLNGTLVNGVLPASRARFATAGTGLTAMPASITPASNTFSMFTYFSALS